MNILKLILSFTCAWILSACAGHHPIAGGAIDASPAMPTESLKPAQDVASDTIAPPVPTPASAPTPPTPTPLPPPVSAKFSEQSWTMKAGKLHGADQLSPKLISKSKDPKTGQTITSTCFKYSDFAIEEVRVTGEIGAAEINVRRTTTPRQSLCAADFKGSVKNLPAIEGFFAGATPDYVVIEGADPAEAIPNFQLISLKTMKQIYRGRHEPGQNVVLTKSGGKTSLTFYAPLNVKCELASEGAACWKDVLKLNNVRTKSPLPDCQGAFAKAKASPEESAIVTMRAQVKDVELPKVEFLGGPAICRPEK